MTAFAPPVVAWRGATPADAPAGLLARTWTYLVDEAGSATTAVRDPGGHGLSAQVAGAVRRWFDALSLRGVTT